MCQDYTQIVHTLCGKWRQICYGMCWDRATWCQYSSTEHILPFQHEILEYFYNYARIVQYTFNIIRGGFKFVMSPPQLVLGLFAHFVVASVFRSESSSTIWSCLFDWMKFIWRECFCILDVIVILNVIGIWMSLSLPLSFGWHCHCHFLGCPVVFVQGEVIFILYVSSSCLQFCQKNVKSCKVCVSCQMSPVQHCNVSVCS